MKDAYWFRHDSNAKDDPKIMLLIDQLNPEGYGIYWILIELLRNEPGYRYPLKLIPSVAKRYNTSHQKMYTVIKDFELFEFDDEDFFFSVSLQNRMAALDARRAQAREAGVASGKTRKALAMGERTSVQRPFNDRSTTDERTEKNIKEKKPNYHKKLKL